MAQSELSEEEAAEMSSRNCKRRARMTLPPPSARLRARRTADALRRITDAMKGTELPAVVYRPPSRSAEELSRVDEAAAILP